MIAGDGLAAVPVGCFLYGAGGRSGVTTLAWGGMVFAVSVGALTARVAVGFLSLVGGGWRVAPCSVGFMRKKSDMTDGFGPWTGHVLKMYRKEIWENLLLSIVLGVFVVPCALMVVAVPIKAMHLWVTGDSLPELPYPNLLVVVVLCEMVCVLVVVSFRRSFVRSVKDLVLSIRVRNVIREHIEKGNPVTALWVGVNHWACAMEGPDGRATVNEFLEGLEYMDEGELVGKI